MNTYPQLGNNFIRELEQFGRVEGIFKAAEKLPTCKALRTENGAEISALADAYRQRYLEYIFHMNRSTDDGKMDLASLESKLRRLPPLDEKSAANIVSHIRNDVIQLVFQMHMDPLAKTVVPANKDAKELFEWAGWVVNGSPALEHLREIEIRQAGSEEKLADHSLSECATEFLQLYLEWRLLRTNHQKTMHDKQGELRQLARENGLSAQLPMLLMREAGKEIERKFGGSTTKDGIHIPDPLPNNLGSDDVEDLIAYTLTESIPLKEIADMHGPDVAQAAENYTKAYLAERLNRGNGDLTQHARTFQEKLGKSPVQDAQAPRRLRDLARYAEAAIDDQFPNNALPSSFKKRDTMNSSSGVRSL